MTNLPSNQAYIQSEETDADSPVSEATMQKIGSAINFINDLFQQVEIFTSNGSFTVPEGVERVYVTMCGGGGGGGGGNAAGAGGGGAGSVPVTMLLNVTPADVYSVTVGTGGSGGGGASNGTNGNLSQFNGPQHNFKVEGAGGGLSGQNGGTGGSSPSRIGSFYTNGGDDAQDGQGSIFGDGGASGGASGGGGGGAGFNLNGGADGGASGGNGLPASTRPGCGGGGAGLSGGSTSGGNGGPGIVIVGY